MILTALNNYYDRLVARGDPDIAPFGFSYESLSYVLVLDSSGALLQVIELMDSSGRVPKPVKYLVPQPPKRSGQGASPSFLWDKAEYVLGVTAKDSQHEKQRAVFTQDAFREYHLDLLQDEIDEGLVAVRIFLEKWRPEEFMKSAIFTDEMKVGNFAFRLDGEMRFVHQRPRAVALLGEILERSEGKVSQCLVTGRFDPISRLHPWIKGVEKSDKDKGSIVTFNQDASESYGKCQGDNAPISEKATFGYVTALNHLLRRDQSNHHRLQIGDATVVFWAEADTDAQASAGESLFSLLIQPPTDPQESMKLHSALAKIASGRPLQELDTDLQEQTRIFVLGLAPNASRLSIRFWETARLEAFARRLAEHFQDMVLDPLPWRQEPAIWRLLSETVPHREGSKPKLDDVAPQLAGEMARAILTGGRYPRSLLANLIMRMRADGDISDLRVALCKAVLVRDARLSNRQNPDKEIPVSLDVENRDPGYVLGRLFALLEQSQSAALGHNVNATIRDRYYGAASATPASVFPMLLRNLTNHLGKVRKSSPGLAVVLERQIGEIVDLLGPGFPKRLAMEAQGRFAIGYYHQNRNQFKKSDTTDKEGDEQ